MQNRVRNTALDYVFKFNTNTKTKFNTTSVIQSTNKKTFHMPVFLLFPLANVGDCSSPTINFLTISVSLQAEHSLTKAIQEATGRYMSKLPKS